jgi:uncharacterized cupredoxin-like copper-binding protein
MQLNRSKLLHVLLGLSALVLWCALALLASSPPGAQAGAPASDSSPTPAVNPSPASVQINASMAEFSVTGDPSDVPSGDVQFNVTNHGAAAHEFVIMQTDNPPNALLYDNASQKAVEDAPGQQDVGEVGGELPFIPPGETESDSFTLPPGNYVLICNVPGHYKAGMHTAFTIGPSPATDTPTVVPSIAAKAPPPAPGASGSNSVVQAVVIIGALGLLFTMMLGSMVFLVTRLRDV